MSRIIKNPCACEIESYFAKIVDLFFFKIHSPDFNFILNFYLSASLKSNIK